MWPFRRNKQPTNGVLPEIQDYYQSEQKQRVGVAWLLALVTLVVTVLVASGLFFGGRWTYRKFAHKQTKTTQTAQQQTDTGNHSATSSSSSSSKKTKATTAPSTSTSSTKATQPAPSGSNTATSTPQNSELPNSGPGDVLGIFAVTTISAAALHQLVVRRRLHA